MMSHDALCTEETLHNMPAMVPARSTNRSAQSGMSETGVPGGAAEKDPGSVAGTQS